MGLKGFTGTTALAFRRRAWSAALAVLALAAVPAPAAAEASRLPSGGLSDRLGQSGVRLAGLVGSGADSYFALSPTLSGLFTGKSTALPPATARLAGLLGLGTEALLGIPATGSLQLGSTDFATWFDGAAAEAYHQSPPPKTPKRPPAGHEPPATPAPVQGRSLYLFSSHDDGAAQGEVVKLADRLDWQAVKGAPFSIFASPRKLDPYYLAAGAGIVALSDSRPWLERVLSRALGKAAAAHPLEDSARFRATLSRLPGNGLAFFYVDLAALTSKSADTKGTHSSRPAGSRAPFVGAEALEALDAIGASIRTDSEGVVVDSEAHFDTRRAHFPQLGAAFDPASLSTVSRGAVGFLSFTLPPDFARSLLASPLMPQLPGLTPDSFDWLKGDVNLVVMPTGKASPSLPLAGYMALRTPDLTGARAGMQELSLFTQILLQNKDGSPSGAFEPATIGYSDWSLWRPLGEEARALGGFGFGAKDMFVAIGRSAVRAAASHTAITDDPEFESVYRHLPTPSSVVAYIDVPRMLDLGLKYLTANPSTHLDPAFAAVYQNVRALGFAIDSPWLDHDGFAHGVVFVRLASGWDK